VREACATYTSVSGNDTPQVIDLAKRAMAQGFRHVRLQVGVPGMAAYAAAEERTLPKCRPWHDRPVFEPKAYILRAVKMLHECRKALGDEVELLHDVHERISPREAVPVRQGCGGREAVLPGRRAFTRGHRLLPPDSPAMHYLDRPWASCSTARTNGRRSSPSG